MKHNFIPIEQALKQIFKDYGREDEYYFAYLSSNWEQIIGKSLAKVSRPIALKKKKLTLKTNTELWKNEFIKRTEQILEMINRKTEGFEIKEINIF